jgi:hypothetical protein
MKWGNKYRNKKITADGLVFDSQKEYRRYRELLLLVQAGKIHDLFRQVRFELIPAQYECYPRYSEKSGKRLTDGTRCVEKAVNYVADFVYWEGDQMVVEDVKGVRTDAYILKRKLMLERHSVRIREV